MNIIRAQIAPGETYWKLVKADGPEEWGGRHSVFVDVWDEQGNRIVGMPVTFWWNNGSDTKPTELKEGEPFAVDFPMYAAGEAYGVRVGNGFTDQVFGMGLIANQKHVVYKLIFQRAVAEGMPVVEPPPSVPGKDVWQLYRNGVLVYESE